ncbi:alpha/beta fold hydrolase [Neobacillus terrae]|uniref:alpha/beta fold hydrolase n=1 Tax=Neobacillus terrae TaxID=3034837 RepID=UPI00140B277E|nr:alpha/beta fold hydrolase [Neobacillus terrae]NHM29927.1 alpha/beta fold hydrolase [Neobacillus terrae]
MWKKSVIQTPRGIFELFTQGHGEPICVTHLYSEFNELGNYFADTLVNDFKVYLVNLKEAGNSCKAKTDKELSMKETVKDLESIREALGFKKWNFAGHSTGGMLGLVYSFVYPDSLTKLLVGGATATNKYMEHEGSMYSPNSPLNKQLKSIFSILQSSTSTSEERKNASRQWTSMSLYKPEKWDEYFSKPSSGRVIQKRLDYYSYKELPDYDIISELREVKLPTFIYCGKYDTQCPLIFSEEINSILKNSRLYVFESSNHSPFLEEKQKFACMISDFKALTMNHSC